jgi:hypothetical protein
MAQHAAAAKQAPLWPRWQLRVGVAVLHAFAADVAVVAQQNAREWHPETACMSSVPAIGCHLARRRSAPILDIQIIRVCLRTRASSGACAIRCDHRNDILELLSVC